MTTMTLGGKCKNTKKFDKKKLKLMNCKCSLLKSGQVNNRR